MGTTITQLSRNAARWLAAFTAAACLFAMSCAAAGPAGEAGARAGCEAFAAQAPAASLSAKEGSMALAGRSAGASVQAATGTVEAKSSSGKYTYKRGKAVSYADKYWKHYNRSYREYPGVDCANFVSQCLRAGGIPTEPGWYTGWSPESYNWINVMGMIRYFKSYGTFVAATNANVTAGNPVFYDWNGDGTYDHAAICVGRNASGTPIVDAHTTNVYHKSWRMGNGGRRATILLRSSGTARYVAKNTWQTVNGKTCYIGADGKRVKGKFLTIGGARYYFGSSGARKTGFFKVGKKWYYASVKTGKLLKGWQVIGGKVYYFKSDYSRITSGRHKIKGATYCFNSKGVRKTGFLHIGSKWYYADKKTGKFLKGWQKIGGKWYYFDKKTMAGATGWKTINGRRCYFNSKGVLIKGRHG